MSTTAKPDYSDPIIRKLEARLEVIKTAHAARRNTSNDKVVGVASVHSIANNGPALIAVMRNGSVYRLEDNDMEPDWTPMPPVPGTDARLQWDAVRKIEAEIAQRKAELGDLA